MVILVQFKDGDVLEFDVHVHTAVELQGDVSFFDALGVTEEFCDGGAVD